MKLRTALTVVFLAVVGVAGPGVAAPQQDPETSSRVPELFAFHEIIYPIWHSAYPNKDYQALRSYVPEIKRLAAKVYATSLPGILRDKQTKWAEGVALLRKAVDDYSVAAEGADNQALLDAAETLHARFEGLARIIIPVIPEVDAFHKVLYVVYHKYAPDKAYEKVRATVPDLLARAGAVVAAKLPAAMSPQKDAFQKAAAALLDAVRALETAAAAHDHKGMEAAIEAVHGRYQALEKIFENVRIPI